MQRLNYIKKEFVGGNKKNEQEKIMQAYLNRLTTFEEKSLFLKQNKKTG